MKVGIIIQARTSSARLPKKILLELPYSSGITTLAQVIRRTKQSKKIAEIIVATTFDKDDNSIITIAQQEGVKWFQGDKNNVLKRFYLTAKKFQLDKIIRITSDCPCVDPALINLILDKHIDTNSDYTSNVLTRSFPYGLDVEIINFDVLLKCYQNAKKDFEKEHVTPYIYQNKHLFKICSIKAEKIMHAPDIRITLDTEEDYALLCAVFDYLYKDDNFFDTKDILNLFAQKPWLKIINRKIIHKKIYNNLNDELNEAIKLMDYHNLSNAKRIIEKTLINKL